MKISINIFSDRNKYTQNIHNTAMSQNVTKKTAIKPFVSIYDNSNFYPPNINFSGLRSIRKEGLFIFSEPGIICPYSGIKMVPSSLFKTVLTEEALSGTGRAAIKALSQFEESMFETERKIFDKLKALRENDPKASLQALLALCRPESLDKLQKAQYKIFSVIEELSGQLPQDSPNKAALNPVLEDARNLAANDTIRRIFKRKAFIAKLSQIRDTIPPEKQEERQIFDKICAAAQELKTSENNVHAFVVKYSGRSSTEIGQRLVEPSVSTFEHIIPDSEDGEMALSNGLAVCRKFNKKRSNMPYKQFIELYPQIPENCQRYMDCVIDLIRKHRYTEYASYPQDIASKLFVESEGLINIDWSRLGRFRPKIDADDMKHTPAALVNAQ